jgi:ribosomal protein S18 acetylase RimI-like enzyme
VGTMRLHRHRMEIRLTGLPPLPVLPDNLLWVPWDDSLMGIHAEVHYHSFADCIDRKMFTSFADPSGCWYTLNQIRHKSGFLPEATWLIAGAPGACGTIQCIKEGWGYGSIQNVGVIPSWRGKGLGEALVLRALYSFVAYGLRKASLEVTAENTAALRLYLRMGFRKMNTSCVDLNEA